MSWRNSMATLLFCCILLAVNGAYAEVGAAEGQTDYELHDRLREQLRHDELLQQGAPKDLVDEYIESPVVQLDVAQLVHRSRSYPWKSSVAKDSDWVIEYEESSSVELHGRDAQGRMICSWHWQEDLFNPLWSWGPGDQLVYVAIVIGTDETGADHVLAVTEFKAPQSRLPLSFAYRFCLDASVLPPQQNPDLRMYINYSSLEVVEQRLWKRYPPYMLYPRPVGFSAFDVFLKQIQPSGKNRWQWSAVLPFEFTYGEEERKSGNKDYVVFYDRDGWIVAGTAVFHSSPGPYPGSTKVFGVVKSKRRPFDLDVFTSQNVAGG
jgi:hypothetical protein